MTRNSELSSCTLSPFPLLRVQSLFTRGKASILVVSLHSLGCFCLSLCSPCPLPSHSSLPPVTCSSWPLLQTNVAILLPLPAIFPSPSFFLSKMTLINGISLLQEMDNKTFVVRARNPQDLVGGAPQIEVSSNKLPEHVNHQKNVSPS